MNHFTRYTFAISESDEEEQMADIPIELSINSDQASHSSKRIREDFQPQLIQAEAESKPLVFTSKFRFSVSPQGKIYLPAEDGSLVRYFLTFDNAEAEIGLKIHQAELKFLKNPEDQKFEIEKLEKFWFDLAQTYSGMDDSNKIPSEAMVWTLFCVLFGNPSINIRQILETPMIVDSEYMNPNQKQLKRKKALYSWLCG